MATDYTVAANAIVAVLHQQIDILGAELPDFMQWRERANAKIPAIAGACAKAAVDAVNAARTPQS